MKKNVLTATFPISRLVDISLNPLEWLATTSYPSMSFHAPIASLDRQ
jgi:hypothetical protein